jgi:hypothetical protein
MQETITYECSKFFARTLPLFDFQRTPMSYCYQCMTWCGLDDFSADEN